MLIANNPVMMASAPSPSHPVALSLEQYCWLFSRVRKLNYSISSLDASSSSPQGSVLDAADALAALIAATSSQGEFSASGSAERFLEEKESNIAAPSPIWRSANLEIDMGRSVCFLGLYYPWIRISAGEINSFSPSVSCGSVRFLSGLIPLYSNSSSTIAAGKITVSQTYDELKLSEIQNREAVFRSDSNFSKYTKATLGGVKCSVAAASGLIRVSVPQAAKSGHIAFICDGPPYDSFLSLDRVIF